MPSLKATIEYSVGTLGGAVYAGAIAALVPHHDEISLLAVLALAVAPLALLAAVNPHFRVGPFTAVIVVLGASAAHTDPIGSAFYRVHSTERDRSQFVGGMEIPAPVRMRFSWTSAILHLVLIACCPLPL
jgi:hypothetical protein